MSAPALPTVPVGRALLVNGLLAFVAGYVDVVGFVALSGLFTAHVTGNFVLIGAEIAALSTQGVVGKLLALPVFVVVVAATRLAVLHLEHRGRGPLRPLLGAELLLLGLFLAAGLAARPIVSADSPPAMLAGLLGVAAMAIQNAKARLILANHAPTTIMTGNTTQVVIDLVDLLRPGTIDREASRTRLVRMAPALLIFAAGALLGALGFAAASFWCLLAPMAALGVLVLGTPDARPA
ncbi:YoaK family protein [Vineibacter terrae]|uniref:YoaK family protein n=1 Tax=Vineibacter terrae TaxID=2586908 RepID=UPI002E35B4D8|nr:DUF1275 family protein [Vineibacter terrae]HEX2891779.1 DUF1275 family protein [Vineibacter terrae]